MIKIQMKNILKSTTFLAIFACWLWSTAFAAVKIGLEYNTPFQFAGIRFIISGIFLFLYFGKPAAFYYEFKSNWKFILVLAVIQFSAQYAFFYTGMNLVPSAFGAMIIGSGPLFVAIVAHYMLQNDKMTLLKTGSIVIGLTGIAIITLGRTKVEFRGNLELLGVGLLFVNNFLSGYSNVLVAKHQTGRSPVVLSSASLFIGGLILFLISIPLEGINTGPFPPVYFFTLGWLSFLSAAAFAVWFTLLQRPGVKVSDLNMWKFLIPVLGAVLSWILIREEKPDAISIFGMAVITVSLVTLNYANRKGK
ncbi:MAG: DMT family transporter [Bacteroidia bacterium]|nr:DMT family transporter [Bacteroidia bacterium]